MLKHVEDTTPKLLIEIPHFPARSQAAILPHGYRTWLLMIADSECSLPGFVTVLAQ